MNMLTAKHPATAPPEGSPITSMTAAASRQITPIVTANATAFLI